VGVKAIEKVAETIITPIITFSLESTRMKTGDYKYVSIVAARLLPTVPLWALFEYNLTPPSIVIQRNKLLATHRC
jgi:hypothetical protein